MSNMLKRMYKHKEKARRHAICDRAEKCDSFGKAACMYCDLWKEQITKDDHSSEEEDA